MTLTLPAEQPPEPPSIPVLFARVENLPYYLAALCRAALNRPGTTGAELLRDADVLDQVAAECRQRDLRGLLEPEAQAWADAAAILRDAAPRYPHPPRLPANAEQAMQTAPLQRTAFGQRRRDWGAPTLTQGGGEI